MATIAQRFDPAFPIDELVEHPDNPRRGDEAAIEESMKAHGFYGAVLAQASSRRIIAGNHRTRVARRRGEATLPVLFLDVDDEQARRLLLVDNRSNDLATYDARALAAILEDLSKSAGGLVGTGYDVADLAKLLERWQTPGDPDAVPEPPAEARTQPGDLWLLGDHRLLCGDSTDAGDVDRLLDGITPKAMVTDPPYLVDYTGQRLRPGGQSKHIAAYQDPPADGPLYVDFLARAIEHLHPEAPIYQWFADRRGDVLREAWRANGLLLHQYLYWVKPRIIVTHTHFHQQIEPCAYGWRDGHQPPLRRRPGASKSNVWQLAHDVDGWEHPTVKPVELVTEPYTWHLRAGEWAYEPFSGSGTAIAAGEVTGRRVAAIEIAPIFVDVACLRWQRLTGRKPVHEASGEPVDFDAA